MTTGRDEPPWARLAAGNPGPMTGRGNWTYLLPGVNPVMIDAGVGAEAHLEAIAAVRPDGPGHVLVTHAHSDHAAGVGAIRRRWPSTRFSKFPWAERDGRYAVDWSPLADGDRIDAGDGVLQAVHTPGHAPDHVCFWDSRSRTLFGGDLVVRGSTVVIPASAGGSLAAYLDSLARVLALEPASILPAHGPRIDDPAVVLREYLDHRQQRERQVVHALETGVHELEAMVASIYTGLASGLVPMARETVLAHLVKLEAEKRACRAGDAWRLTSDSRRS